MVSETISTAAAAAREAQAAPAPERKKGPLGTIVRLIVSLGAIGLVLAYTNFDDAIAHAKTQDFSLVALAILIMTGQLGAGALRWHSIRRGLGAGVSFGNSLRLFLIGSFFGSYVFTGLSGDFMRVFMSIRGGIDAAKATQSVVFDRIAVLTGIAVMLVAASPWMLTRLGSGFPVAMPLAFAAALGVGIAVAAYFHRLPAKWLTVLPMRLLSGLSEAMHSVFMRPGVVIRTLLAAILGQMMFAAAAWSLARSLGVGIGMVDCLVIMQLVALVTALPISVGGWGAREVSMVGLLGLIGVAPPAALLLSVELGLVGLLVNLPGGLVWLAARPQEKSGPIAPPAQA